MCKIPCAVYFWFSSVCPKYLECFQFQLDVGLRLKKNVFEACKELGNIFNLMWRLSNNILLVFLMIIWVFDLFRFKMNSPLKLSRFIANLQFFFVMAQKLIRKVVIS